MSTGANEPKHAGAEEPVTAVPERAEVQPSKLEPIRSPSPEPDEKAINYLEANNKTAAGGQAVINQREAIPTTGKRMPTGRWEYISFCIFCKSIRSSLGDYDRELTLHRLFPQRRS